MTTTVLLATIFWYALFVISGGLFTIGAWVFVAQLVFQTKKGRKDSIEEFTSAFTLMFGSVWFAVLLFGLSYLMGW
jgi:hypothetical protein